ncbi:MAG: carbon-nitrogen hydrolase family protein, partial [Alphaproteobacteria bacterium]
VQAAPCFMDRQATTEKTVRIIKDAAREGAKLVAFPECWIPGYPWFIWLGAPAWGMQFIQRYHANALEVESEETRAICEAAKANKIYVSLGFSERSGGSLYISQMLIDDEGDIITARRKLKPTHVERTVFGEGDGSGLNVDETPLGRIGMLCCWEHLQPLSKYALYAMNEQIHIAAWPSFSLYEGVAYALGPDVNTSASRIYAAEGQCFVIAPCAVVSEDMVDMMCDTEERRAFLKPGGGHARIFAPDGRELGSRLKENEEGLVVADIDLGAIALSKAAADPAGHYARPDVTRLLLNRAPARPVEMVHDHFMPTDAGEEEPDSEGEIATNADEK